MAEDNVQDTVQENQDTQVENKQETPSEPSLLQEVMSKKAAIKDRDNRIAELEAEKEKGRQKKLAEEGKYKELDAEKTAIIDKMKAQLESQTGIVNNYKQNLINGLTSDDERKEHYATKDVSFLEDLTKEKALIQPPISNPGESLGAVRNPLQNKNYADMTEVERRAFHELNFKQN